MIRSRRTVSDKELKHARTSSKHLSHTHNRPEPKGGVLARNNAKLLAAGTPAARQQLLKSRFSDVRDDVAHISENLIDILNVLMVQSNGTRDAEFDSEEHGVHHLVPLPLSVHGP